MTRLLISGPARRHQPVAFAFTFGRPSRRHDHRHGVGKEIAFGHNQASDRGIRGHVVRVHGGAASGAPVAPEDLLRLMLGRALQKFHQRGAILLRADALLGHLGAGRIGRWPNLEQL